MYISIDIGGTNIRIAKSEKIASGNFHFNLIAKNKLIHDYQTDLNNLINDLSGLKDIEFIGMGLPGDVRNRNFYSSNNLPEWENKDFVQFLEKNFNCRVEIDNDGVVAAFGEAVYGNGKDLNSFLYITWGTGIGGAKVGIQNGIPSVEKINWEKYFERWEELWGGKNLENKYDKDLGQLTDLEWAEVFENFYNEFIQISKLLNNKNIVIGGGASTKHIKEFEILSNRLKEKGINLKVSKLGDDAGLYGGFALSFGKKD